MITSAHICKIQLFNDGFYRCSARLTHNSTVFSTSEMDKRFSGRTRHPPAVDLSDSQRLVEVGGVSWGRWWNWAPWCLGLRAQQSCHPAAGVSGSSMAFPMGRQGRQRELCQRSSEKPEGWLLLKAKTKGSFPCGCCCPREGVDGWGGDTVLWPLRTTESVFSSSVRVAEGSRWGRGVPAHGRRGYPRTELGLFGPAWASSGLSSVCN